MNVPQVPFFEKIQRQLHQVFKQRRLPLNIGQRPEHDGDPGPGDADHRAEQGEEDQPQTDDRQQAVVMRLNDMVGHQLRSHRQQQVDRFDDYR